MSNLSGDTMRSTSSLTVGIDGLPAVSSSSPLLNEGKRSNSSSYMGSPIVPGPKERKGRTLVLCFDGTGDEFDADNSNVVNFFSALSKGDPDNQMVYYQTGIGTYGGNPVLTKTSEVLDEAVAWNLGAHIMDGYEFLMQNYRANDKICIFGFSRGAYTARCLAGMLHKVGLLPTCNHQQVPFAYKMYTHADEYGWKQSNAFKKAFSIDVDIEFLGVWDTVNSVGIIPRRLPFTASNTMVRTFRHAIALDERRGKFKVNVWNRPTDEEQLLSITDQEAAKKAQKAEQRKASGNDDHKGHLHHYEEQYSTIRHETNVEEVWFAGCHCDVGGGSVSNATKHSLARIPLRWMIRECFKSNTGIMFKVDELRRLGMYPESLFPAVLPRPPALSPEPTNFIEQIPDVQPSILTQTLDAEDDPYLKMSEEEHELLDALSPKYDQLEMKKSWWIGEFLMPVRDRYQDSTLNDKWVEEWGLNMGRGRHIPRQKTQGVKLHRSVQTRLSATFENGEKYVPKAANLDLTKVKWVD
ncbi:hypothetical protein NMY22_g11861 [Coprinellus aureogranulatus]|nr:hypothetical protein NMY22_g11861 [Coprinellus aureogranulatus]